MKKLINILLLLLFAQMGLMAQSAHFKQYYNSSTFLNPSLTGIEQENQATILYRNHWPQLENSFITQAFLLELAPGNGEHSFGLNFMNDRAGAGNYAVNSIGASYAYELALNRKWYLRSGINAGYSIKSVNWNELVFEDMLDSREGVVYDSQQPQGSNLDFWDLSAGFTLFSEKHFVGLAVDHLTQPKGGLINANGEALMKRAYTIHAGSKIDLERKQSLTPTVIYKVSGENQFYQMGALLELDHLNFGAWYGSEQSLILAAGVNLKMLSFSYSYDLFSSTMLNQNLSSHELSVRYRFESKGKSKKKYRAQPCPKF